MMAFPEATSTNNANGARRLTNTAAISMLGRCGGR